jgi:hypothetical protein
LEQSVILDSIPSLWVTYGINLQKRLTDYRARHSVTNDFGGWVVAMVDDVFLCTVCYKVFGGDTLLKVKAPYSQMYQEKFRERATFI